MFRRRAGLRIVDTLMVMSRVEEIEAQINGLSEPEYLQLVHWIQEREQDRWDAQIDRDHAAGKLDFLFAEAEAQAAAGLLRPWPEEDRE